MFPLKVTTLQGRLQGSGALASGNQNTHKYNQSGAGDVHDELMRMREAIGKQDHEILELKSQARTRTVLHVVLQFNKSPVPDFIVHQLVRLLSMSLSVSLSMSLSVRPIVCMHVVDVPVLFAKRRLNAAGHTPAANRM